MKYVVILPDGMADNRYAELNNKSPLEYAQTPAMDFIASNGIIGKVKTIPDGMPPGSDVAIMSVMGYDPEKYYMSRGPLEAVSLKIPFTEHDIIFRFNNVTIKDGLMASSNAGHITTNNSKKVIDYFNSKIKINGVKFFEGTSYRHIMLIDSRVYPDLDYLNLECAPPHDIVNQKVENYLPKGKGAALIKEIMDSSYSILKDYESENKFPPNMFWPWGQGKIKKIANFKDTFGVSGSVISAVDLIKGLGGFVGLDVIEVEGATGYYDTNFKGKADAAITSLKEKDFVFVHLEATDEAGHDGNMQKKIEMIETIDNLIVSPILKYLKQNHSDFRIMVLPDHPTPVSLRTHENKPVPFAIYDSREHSKSGVNYSEFFDLKIENQINNGYDLMKKFIEI